MIYLTVINLFLGIIGTLGTIIGSIVAYKRYHAKLVIDSVSYSPQPLKEYCLFEISFINNSIRNICLSELTIICDDSENINVLNHVSDEISNKYKYNLQYLPLNIPALSGCRCLFAIKANKDKFSRGCFIKTKTNCNQPEAKYVNQKNLTPYLIKWK